MVKERKKVRMKESKTEREGERENSGGKFTEQVDCSERKRLHEDKKKRSFIWIIKYNNVELK